MSGARGGGRLCSKLRGGGVLGNSDFFFSLGGFWRAAGVDLVLWISANFGKVSEGGGEERRGERRGEEKREREREREREKRKRKRKREEKEKEKERREREREREIQRARERKRERKKKN